MRLLKIVYKEWGVIGDEEMVNCILRDGDKLLKLLIFAAMKGEVSFFFCIFFLFLFVFLYFVVCIIFSCII